MKATPSRLRKLRSTLRRQRSHHWWSTRPITRAAQILLWEQDLWDGWAPIAHSTTTNPTPSK